MAFKGITGPGQYKTRSGRLVAIVSNDGDESYPWDAADGECYTTNGSVYLNAADPQDIIEGPLDEPQEMAGLTGFAVWTQGGSTLLTTNYYSFEAIPSIYAAGKIIDLSKVPASAIVKPEKKRVRGWLNLRWDSNKPGEAIACGLFPTRNEADETAAHYTSDDDGPCIACIEIEFTEGDGL